MKKLTVIAFFFGIMVSNAQKSSVNLIISVDEKIPTSSIVVNHITYTDSKGKLHKYSNLKYLQGSLSIPKEIFEKLKSDNIKDMYLSIEYWEYCKDKRKDYSYEIEIKKSYLEYGYLILYLFNLDKKKFNKIYFPISEGENYTYYFDYPSSYKGRLVQKRLTKEQKKCGNN